MKKTIKLTIFLALVAALATALLAGVNSITAPIILENASAAQFAMYESLYPQATNFESLEFTPDSNNLVKEAIKVDDSAYVFRVENQGYSDVVNFLIGFDKDGTNAKYAVLSVNDTPNIGSQVAEDTFIQQVTGKSTSDTFDTISGATVTSSAVVNGIKAAIGVFDSLTGNESNQATNSTPPEAIATVIEINESDLGTLVSHKDNTFIVKAKGFSGENTFEITLNQKGEVESIKMVEFNDTKGIGDKVDQNYLDSLVGLNLMENASIDSVTSATMTTKSLASALRVVSEQLQGE